MKQLLLIICVFATVAAGAQNYSDTVTASDIEIIRSGGNVTISFTLGIGEKATRPAYDLVIDPVLQNGSFRKSLRSIVVRSRRARVLDERHSLSGGVRNMSRQALYIEPGDVSDYTVTIPFEQWMSGGRLLLTGASIGCSTSSEVALGIVADNILASETVVETKVVETKTVIEHSTGEELEEKYPFVASFDEFASVREALQRPDNRVLVDRMIDQTREGSISVYFAQGRKDIDRFFGDNNKGLVQLISAVRMLDSANDAGIAAVVIAGFASPEGSPSLNDRLAWDRAVAVKQFLTDNTTIDPSTVRIFNGGADWEGLRELVARSDIYQKNRILDIIDSRDATRLRRYHYALEGLYAELRQAAYIKVFYDEK